MQQDEALLRRRAQAALAEMGEADDSDEACAHASALLPKPVSSPASLSSSMAHALNIVQPSRSLNGRGWKAVPPEEMNENRLGLFAVQ